MSLIWLAGLAQLAVRGFGPMGVSLSLPLTSLVAGEDAGPHSKRHYAAYVAGAGGILIGLLAGVAASLPEIIPLPFLLAIAGLSLMDVLGHALRQMTQGPLLLGPLLAFAIALSEISLLGFGPFFWAIVIGSGVSFALERDALDTLREPEKS